MEVVPWAVQTYSKKSSSIARKAIGGLGSPSEIELTYNSTVQNISDTPGSKSCKFSISTDNSKPILFSAPDHRFVYVYIPFKIYKFIYKYEIKYIETKNVRCSYTMFLLVFEKNIFLLKKYQLSN